MADEELLSIEEVGELVKGSRPGYQRRWVFNFAKRHNLTRYTIEGQGKSVFFSRAEVRQAMQGPKRVVRTKKVVESSPNKQ